MNKELEEVMGQLKREVNSLCEFEDLCCEIISTLSLEPNRKQIEPLLSVNQSGVHLLEIIEKWKSRFKKLNEERTQNA